MLIESFPTGILTRRGWERKGGGTDVGGRRVVCKSCGICLVNKYWGQRLAQEEEERPSGGEAGRCSPSHTRKYN